MLCRFTSFPAPPPTTPQPALHTHTNTPRAYTHSDTSHHHTTPEQTGQEKKMVKKDTKKQKKNSSHFSGQFQAFPNLNTAAVSQQHKQQPIQATSDHHQADYNNNHLNYNSKKASLQIPVHSNPPPPPPSGALQPNFPVQGNPPSQSPLQSPLNALFNPQLQFPSFHFKPHQPALTFLEPSSAERRAGGAEAWQTGAGGAWQAGAGGAGRPTDTLHSQNTDPGQVFNAGQGQVIGSGQGSQIGQRGEQRPALNTGQVFRQQAHHSIKQQQGPHINRSASQIF